MSRTDLPRFARDAWAGGFVFDSPRWVSCVSVSGGSVLAAGREEMYLLGPGEVHMRKRPLPGGMKVAAEVAVEPRRRPRLVVCCPETISVLDGNALATLRDGDDGPGYDGVAWGKRPGGFALYILGGDSRLRRTQPEKGGVEEIPIEDVRTLASDGRGTIGVVSKTPEPRVWVTHDGDEWFWRAIPAWPVSRPYSLAVAGDLAAVKLIYEGPAWVSRRRGAPFEACEPLEDAGPLEFEGSGADAALFGVRPEGSTECVVRVEASGNAVQIARIEGDEKAEEAPRVSNLAWDETRRTLWGALPRIGLIKSEAPVRAGGKRSSLS
jgi:hypothetical protein